MRALIKTSLFLLLISQTSCEDMNFYNCNNCFEDEPYECELEITLSTVYNAVENYYITVYLGKVEDNNIIYEQDVTDSFSLTLPLNSEYSVKAIYTRNGNDYVSINSSFPKVKYLDNYCETPCYIIKGDKIDMRLKYY